MAEIANNRSYMQLYIFYNNIVVVMRGDGHRPKWTQGGRFRGDPDQRSFCNSVIRRVTRARQIARNRP